MEINAYSNLLITVTVAICCYSISLSWL